MSTCRRLIALALQVLALLLAAPALAGPTHIAAELVAETAPAPDGTVTLAIVMRPSKGWHGYWSNPGDAGLGMTLDWALPPGAKAGDPRYPVPETLLISGLMNHVYEHDYAVLVPLRLAPGTPPGATVPISVAAKWLACTDKVCVPEEGVLQAAVRLDSRARPDPRFEAWRAALPAPLGGQATFELAGSRLRLGIPLPAAVALDSPHFFADANLLIDYAAPQAFSRRGDLLIVEIARSKTAPIDPGVVGGVLRLNRAGDGLSLVGYPGAVPAADEPVTERGAPALPWLLLSALAGGLLLNLMPCVFPILSLKALSLARAGESAAQARSEGLAYTAGVMLACLALGGLLLALRAAGQQVGWAFQLQEPLVVAALLLFAVAITANLLGLYEFAIPGFAREGSPQGAFATGLLAAFVATPCTGPFMAAAMGAALLLPTAQALALFAALGLGLALPFLALAFIPALRKRLPKPGGWMAAFKRWMALPMGLTALALLWLASRIGGDGFALTALAVAVTVIAGLAVIGRTQRTGGAVALPALALLAVAGLATALLPRLAAEQSPQAASLLPTKPFSESALAQARASGKPVFVYFTADWCLTCKVNERVAIERAATRDAFAKAGVVVLRGDWTRRDPAITRFLTAHGAAGVPLYLWYPAGGGAPRQLDQVLGPETLAALAR